MGRASGATLNILWFQPSLEEFSKIPMQEEAYLALSEALFQPSLEEFSKILRASVNSLYLDYYRFNPLLRNSLRFNTFLIRIMRHGGEFQPSLEEFSKIRHA